MRWWVLDYYQAGLYVVLLSQIFWVIFSITLHELAHGWAAIWQGDDTPRRLGHMTSNPMVHMGPMSLLTFALVGFAWGLMPTDPSRYRWKRRGRIVVAGAGPAMNIALALAALLGAALWARYGPHSQPLRENVWTFLLTGGSLNIFLAIFNLLPIPPLDGASILMGLSFGFYRFVQNLQVPMIGMFILVAIFMTGLGEVMFSAADMISHWFVQAVMSILP